ncbi:hypothetical protein B0H14DRAFT_3138027 [Mycena olivaceomarginata]|nr:hypothetical protein B0H14DRAFT_3138027 [Mycena olivaceomarginata]
MKVFPNVRCREIEAHTKFEAAHPSSRRLKWSQPRVQDAWTSVAGFSWEGEFNAGMRQTILASSPVVPWIRAVSDDLSMIMTILYSLEKLNGGHSSSSLTMFFHDPERRQIIGAAGPEVNRATIPWGLREILHRLPEVKHLKTWRKGSLTVKCADITGNMASNFQDSCREEDPNFVYLVYREEAEGEAVLLRACGVILHPELGPAKNSWGSLSVRAGTATVYGFQAESGWLAGGFGIGLPDPSRQMCRQTTPTFADPSAEIPTWFNALVSARPAGEIKNRVSHIIGMASVTISHTALSVLPSPALTYQYVPLRRKRARVDANASMSSMEVEVPVEPPTRDANWYFDGGDLIILAENILFRVHKFLLSQDSSMFKDMFIIPRGSNAAERTDRSSDETPLHVSDTVEAFYALLWVLYALPPDLQAYLTNDKTAIDLNRIVSIAETTNKSITSPPSKRGACK